MKNTSINEFTEKILYFFSDLGENSGLSECDAGCLVANISIKPNDVILGGRNIVHRILEMNDFSQRRLS